MSTTPPAAPDQAADPQPDDKRLARLRRYTVQNMVWSMLAVLVVAVAWWALMPNPQELPRQTVDPAPVVGFAADEADYPVLEPTGLGQGWTVTGARYEKLAGTDTLSLRFVTPSGEFAAVDQSGDATDEWARAVLRGSVADGERELAGPGGTTTWQVWSQADEQTTALLREADGATVVVRGTAPVAELEALVASLQPVTRG